MTRTRHRYGGGSARSRQSKTGTSAESEQLERAEAADPEALARTLCLRQLEARSRTRVELERYLARKLVPEDAAARVLDRFTEIGLIDDAVLAHAYTTSRQAEQGLARRAIAVKLKQRGVDEETVAAAVASVDPDDELAAARQLVARKLRVISTLDRVVQTRRLVGMLGRKGYPPGLAYRVVTEALDDAEARSDTAVDDESVDAHDTVSDRFTSLAARSGY